MQPAVRADGAGRLFGHVVVALHDVVAAAQDLAHFAARQFLAGLGVADAHLDAGHGAAHGLAAQMQGVVGVGLGHHRRAFGQAVADGDVLHVHVFHHAPHERLGADGTGHDARAQAGDVEALEHLVFQFGQEHGGHAVQGRAALAVHGGQHMQGVVGFEDDHAGPVVDAGRDPQHAAEAVEERHGQADAVLVGEALVAADPVAVEAHAHMGQHDALGEARGAGGILHVDGVPGVQAVLPGLILGIIGHDGHGQNLGHGIHAAMLLRAQETDAPQMRQAREAEPVAALVAQLGGQSVERVDVIMVAQAVHDEDVLALRLVEQVFELVFAIVGVDRDQDGPDLGRGELQGHPVGHVAGPDGHLFPFLHA